MALKHPEGLHQVGARNARRSERSSGTGGWRGDKRICGVISLHTARGGQGNGEDIQRVGALSSWQLSSERAPGETTLPELPPAAGSMRCLQADSAHYTSPTAGTPAAPRPGSGHTRGLLPSLGPLDAQALPL